MLLIQPVSIEIAQQVRPLLERIARTDPDHARQLRRAMKGVVHNLAEGSGLRAGRRRNAYDIALGESARDARGPARRHQARSAATRVTRADTKTLAQRATA